MSYQKVFIRVLSYVGASSDITSTAVHRDRLLVLYSKSKRFQPSQTINELQDSIHNAGVDQ